MSINLVIFSFLKMDVYWYGEFALLQVGHKNMKGKRALFRFEKERGNRPEIDLFFIRISPKARRY